MFNAIMQRSMKKEAKRVAKELRSIYTESKGRNPSAQEKDIIRRMSFDDDALRDLPESSRNRIMVCCETVQGYCYMMVLDVGKFKNSINIRALQFTKHMDDALQLQGFPSQSKKQKERILDVMNLKISGWDRI